MKPGFYLLAAAISTFAGHDIASGQPGAATPGAEVRCTRVESGSQGPCSANEYLLRRLEREGLGAALAALDSLAARDPEVRRLGHAYAHSIGIAAYEGTGSIGATFGRCTPVFQSGCYHGVVQAYFLARGGSPEARVDVEVVNGLCAEQRDDVSLRWHLFQCAHGLGHGLMMATGNHLPSALEACDLVEDPWEREVCYSAVFMENVVQATAGDGALGRPGASAHVHVAPPVGAGDFPPLKREAPLYPCTVLEERYLGACYEMQTSAILNLNGFDVAAAARACPHAPEPFRPTCFRSLGRDISALTVQNHRKAIALCAVVPDEYEPFCHLGYAKNLVDLTAEPAHGFAFCRLLQQPDSKRVCYTGMGEELWVLEDDVAARAAACEAAEAEYVA
ncbi:MAG TPA: hypothetical protein VMN39_11885, partial [Longimicrobiaceae bacterium]|nr:hypothetical protein [Longimicrobiaceae bacterium]